MSKEKTPETIAQWVIDNRYPQNELSKVSDSEMYHTVLHDIGELMLNEQAEHKLPMHDETMKGLDGLTMIGL